MKPAGSPIWMGNAAQALREAAQVLEKVSDTPRLDVELLMAHALGIGRDQLLLELPNLDAPDAFNSLIARRQQSEPVAHLIGSKEFWGLEFAVSPDVLIPRPDSEIMIEEALRLFSDKPPCYILDLGTGSGALLLSILSEFLEATGLGIDASEEALEVARKNGKNLGLSDRAEFLLSDWTRDGWKDALSGPFDLILANPPYIAADAQLPPDVANFEPHQALFAGKDGLNDYKIIIPALADLLARNGIALLEIGFDQRKSVSNITSENGYVVDCKQDLGGNDRLLILQR